jgi:hypothetical protein
MKKPVRHTFLRRKITLFAILGLMAVYSVSLATPVEAYQEVPPLVTYADYIFIIDQTPSMESPNPDVSGNERGSDPNNIRNQIIRASIYRLGIYELLQRAQGKSVNIEVGVYDVDGTTDGRCVVKLSALGVKDLTSWLNPDAIAPISTSTAQKAPACGQGNHLDALTTNRISQTTRDSGNYDGAYFENVFRNAVKDLSESQKRRKGVSQRLILITDSLPALEGSEANNPEKNHRDKLTALRAGMGSQADNLYVFSLRGGFRGSSSTRSTASYDINKIWQDSAVVPKTNFKFFEPQSRNDLVRDVFDTVQGNLPNFANNKLISSGSFTVQPYQKQLVITTLKTPHTNGSAYSKLQITAPGGKGASDLNSVGSGANQAIEVWAISDPKPGNWTLELSDRGGAILDTYVDTLPMQFLSEIIPDKVTGSQQFGKTRIALFTEGTESSLVPITNSYPNELRLDPVVIVTRPDKSQEKLTLQPVGNRFETLYTFLEFGTYRIKVEPILNTVPVPITKNIFDHSVEKSTFGLNFVKPNERSGQNSEKPIVTQGQSVSASLQMLTETGTLLDQTQYKGVILGGKAQWVAPGTDCLKLKGNPPSIELAETQSKWTFTYDVPTSFAAGVYDVCLNLSLNRDGRERLTYIQKVSRRQLQINAIRYLDIKIEAPSLSQKSTGVFEYVMDATDEGYIYPGQLGEFPYLPGPPNSLGLVISFNSNAGRVELGKEHELQEIQGELIDENIGNPSEKKVFTLRRNPNQPGLWSAKIPVEEGNITYRLKLFYNTNQVLGLTDDKLQPVQNDIFIRVNNNGQRYLKIFLYGLVLFVPMSLIATTGWKQIKTVQKHRDALTGILFFYAYQIGEPTARRIHINKTLDLGLKKDREIEYPLPELPLFQPSFASLKVEHTPGSSRTSELRSINIHYKLNDEEGIPRSATLKAGQEGHLLEVVDDIEYWVVLNDEAVSKDDLEKWRH